MRAGAVAVEGGDAGAGGGAGADQTGHAGGGH